MKILSKILTSIVIFTGIFFVLRAYGSLVGYDPEILVKDLGGLTYLYSTVGIIFAIFAASIIIFESQRWDNIVDAMKGEVSELRELWQWERHTSDKTAHLAEHIKQYLTVLIQNINHHIEKDTKEVENALTALRKSTIEIAQGNSALGNTVMTILDNFVECRTRRINYGIYHVPKTLKNILLFNNIILITLSFLIGVRNPWLNYLFLMSVVVLCNTIYFVIIDMDSPHRIGNWQIKTHDYQNLLDDIAKG